MKHQWKKEEREIYGVKDEPQTIIVPNQKFIMIKGKGNPNEDDFAQRVGVLYSIAYPIKMKTKTLERDYAVYPLEGVWTADNVADKNSFQYNIMIRQPDYITNEIFEQVREIVLKKKPNPLIKDVVFGEIEDGKCVQILHIGAFDEEPMSFAKMDKYIEKNGLSRQNIYHREVYLNDARKTAPEKRKTILRYQVFSHRF